jgi:flavodoxin
MKNLIIYYSYMGNNETLALKLQEKSGWDIFKIEELKKRKNLTIFFDVLFNRKPKIQNINTDLNQYDLIILVSPIWLGDIASPMKSFLRQEKNLSKYAFISLCGGVENQEQRIMNRLKTYVGSEPVNLTQLCVTDMPEEAKNRILGSAQIKLLESDWDYFEDKTDAFIQSLR